MASGYLCTRKNFNENALIALCGADKCVKAVPFMDGRDTYTLGQLPLRDASGRSPICVQRDFTPASPVWRQVPAPLISRSLEPRNRVHLNDILRSLLAQSQRTD